MIFPVLFSLSGLMGYLDVESPSRKEGLHIIAYMAVFSVVLWAPYLLLIFFKWAQLNAKIIALTSLPFVLMSALTLYADLNGVPW
jgi:hypothetical protein